MAIRRFEDLGVWQKARDLSLAIYQVTDEGAFRRDFGLRDQIRRAAVSVMSNIAEGFERYSRSEFRQFLSIARGSASEVRSQLHLAHGLGYMDGPRFELLYEQAAEVGRMIASMRARTGPR